MRNRLAEEMATTRAKNAQPLRNCREETGSAMATGPAHALVKDGQLQVLTRHSRDTTQPGERISLNFPAHVGAVKASPTRSVNTHPAPTATAQRIGQTLPVNDGNAPECHAKPEKWTPFERMLQFFVKGSGCLRGLQLYVPCTSAT